MDTAPPRSFRAHDLTAEVERCKCLSACMSRWKPASTARIHCSQVPDKRVTPRGSGNCWITSSRSTFASNECRRPVRRHHVPLHHHPVRQDSGWVQVATEDPASPYPRSALPAAPPARRGSTRSKDPPHRAPIVSLQLDVLLRFAYSIGARRPGHEAVADADESGRTSVAAPAGLPWMNRPPPPGGGGLTDPSPSVFGRSPPSYRSVGRSPRLSDLRAVPAVLWQLLHAHPVDARTALILRTRFNAPTRLRPTTSSIGDARFLTVVSRLIPFSSHRSGFATPLYLRGFTPILQRELQLPATPRRMAFSRSTVCHTLLCVRPFSDSWVQAHHAFVGLLWPLHFSLRRRPNSAMPARPFIFTRPPRVRTMTFFADLRRFPFGRKNFRGQWSARPGPQAPRIRCSSTHGFVSRFQRTPTIRTPSSLRSQQVPGGLSLQVIALPGPPSNWRTVPCSTGTTSSFSGA